MAADEQSKRAILHYSLRRLKPRGKISRPNRSSTFLTSSVKEKRGKSGMETEQWVEQERAIWNVLPLHPQPQPLESFTSSLIRLPPATGLHSIPDLIPLLAPP